MFFLATVLLIPSFATDHNSSTDLNDSNNIGILGKTAEEIASSVPESEFGGCYIEDGKLIVCLKGSNQFNLNHADRVTSDSISTRNVQYSLAELEEIVDILIPNMDKFKIATLDADEVKNKICIELYEDNDDIYEFIESNQLLTSGAFEISVLEGEVKATVLKVSATNNMLNSALSDSVARASQTISRVQ